MSYEWTPTPDPTAGCPIPFEEATVRRRGALAGWYRLPSEPAAARAAAQRIITAWTGRVEGTREAAA